MSKLLAQFEYTLLVIFKTPRDKVKLDFLHHKFFLTIQNLIRIFVAATEKPHLYLFLDLTQKCHISSSLPQIAYLLTMDHIPSPANPPNAPKKKKPVRETNTYRLQHIPTLLLPEEEEGVEKCEWRWLRDSGYVREKYLRFNPEDIEELDDIDLLQDICHWYNPLLHPSQPTNIYEASYLEFMLNAVHERLATVF